MRQLPFAVAVTLLACVGTATGQGPIGPDVIVADLSDVAHWGASGDFRAYSVGTVSCNIGDEDLDWQANNNRHPVIGQNMYRLKDGRFQQLGLSWLKHGFTTIDSGICGFCPPDGTGDHLSPGCSDPYWASLNGSRSRLGPRYQVNASTGFFPYPYDNSGPTNLLWHRRLRVYDDDVNPALNAGALYFVEGQYVALDDAQAGNGANNASYRRVTISASRDVFVQGVTFQQLPAIHAWHDHGLGVNQPDPDVVLTSVDVIDDGRFWVAAKASDNGDGSWRYEYAIQNLTSDRSGGSFSVAVGAASVSNVGFYAPEYHSGEPWENTPWTWKTAGGELTWSTPETHADNPESSALRWGTLYNYWFDADVAPTSGDATLGLFKPGTPAAVAVSTVVPDATSFGPGDLNCDGAFDAFDIEPFVTAVFDPAQYGKDYPDCDITLGDMNGDGAVDAFDIEPFADALFP